MNICEYWFWKLWTVGPNSITERQRAKTETQRKRHQKWSDSKESWWEALCSPSWSLCGAQVLGGVQSETLLCTNSLWVNFYPFLGLSFPIYFCSSRPISFLFFFLIYLFVFGSTAWLVREGNGTPLQYFCLEIPWTEEPGRLQSMGSLESDTTEQLHFHFSLSCVGEGNGNPLRCSCLKNPRDREAWWAAIYGVAQSRTWLKRLSSSSSSMTCGIILFPNQALNPGP